MTRPPWLYHRAWMTGLFCAVVLVLIEPSIAQKLQTRLTLQQNELAEHFLALAQQKVQFEADLQTAQTIDETLNPIDAETLLAPSNRQHLSQRLESIAASSRLFNVNYLLSPAQTWTEEGPFTGIEGITQSTLTLEADAPHDGDSLGFLARLNALDGRLHLQQLSIKPLASHEDSPLAALNLHITARFLWLTNAPQEASAP